MPIWASDKVHKVPGEIWKGLIQTKLSKKVILATSKVIVEDKTLETQSEANIAESSFDQILYTDASVDQSSTPSGKAATAYIWYNKNSNGEWSLASSGSSNIGYGHSSYSAEAIAISEGLQKLTHQNTSELEIGIFTDSHSNLQTIKKSVAETPEQEKLLRVIRNINTPLVFYHVRSHQDNQQKTLKPIIYAASQKPSTEKT